MLEASPRDTSLCVLVTVALIVLPSPPNQVFEYFLLLQLLADLALQHDHLEKEVYRVQKEREVHRQRFIEHLQEGMDRLCCEVVRVLYISLVACYKKWECLLTRLPHLKCICLSSVRSSLPILMHVGSVAP